MIRCRIIGFLAACRLDDGSELPRWIGRHHAGCPTCRAHYERELQCADRLVVTANDTRVPPPPFLQQRIMANLGDWGGKPQSVAHVWPRWRAAVASLAAIAAAGVLMWGPRPTSDTAGGDVSRETLTAIQKLPNGGTVLAWGTQLDGPLESELQLVVNDARSALAALSRHFLPSDSR